MTLDELLDFTASLLDDLEFGYFTVPQLTRFLNNAQKTAQKQLLQAGQNYYLKCVQTVVDTSSCSLALPLDFLKLHRLTFMYPGQTQGSQPENVLHQITLNQQDLMILGPSAPRGYIFKKNRIILVPAPDLNYTIKMTYSYLVPDMVELTEVPDIPETYHEYLGILAAEDGLNKDGRDPSSLLAKKQFFLDLMKQDSIERGVDAPREVVSTTYEGVPLLF